VSGQIKSDDVVAAAPDQLVPGLGRIPAIQAGYTKRRILIEILFPSLNIIGKNTLLEKLLGIDRAGWTWASGACLVVNRQRFLDLGGFDEQFFSYMEDVAFGLSASKAGMRILATGNEIKHQMSTGSKISNSRRTELLTRARVEFAKRYFGGLSSQLAQIFASANLREGRSA